MTKWFKAVLFIIFLFAFGFKGFGQVRVPVRVVPQNRVTRAGPGRRMEQVKEAFISTRLKLTYEQSRAFWPLYRHYVQDQTAVKILKRQNNLNTAIDGKQQIDRELTYETELVNIRKHYRDEFLKVLPPEKVSELYKSERAFNDEVFKQLSERSVRAGD